MAGKPQDEGGAGVKTRVKTEKKVERPKLWKILFHNDDYTTREFVVWVLRTVFHKSESDAVTIMLHVHRNGVGVAGLFPHDVAETKLKKTQELAREQEYPLLVTMEPEE